MTADTPRQRMRKRLKNALTLLRDGHLTPPYRAPFEVVLRDPIVSLRRYSPDAATPPATPAAPAAPNRPLLLVPPLMVTSEIYDISPELSAVAFLARHGAAVYVTDFGAPEAQEGGLDRTLDDHVLAVSRCINHLRDLHGSDVHLVGYSQGGMFCYQTAAYRKSAGVASIVTFGSPVDIRRNVPFKLDDKLAARLIAATQRVIRRPLEGLRGLPGTLSARGFKLLAPVAEVRHLIQLFDILHDEEAMRRLEPKRRFLGGEGFIAWPGPALRTFVDQFVVQNRMKQGGFVIAGRTVALADITSPICYVVGESDDVALPEAVRAIRVAAPRAQTYPVHVDAGHFGLVVGRAALAVCWPTVLAWGAWHDGRGPRPDILDTAAATSPRDPPTRVDAAWKRLGAWGVALDRQADRLRWQLPRVVRRAMLELGRGGDASLSRTLRERAADLPAAICFLHAGRAFTFREADQRVDDVAAALAAQGVVAGQRVPLPDRTDPESLALFLAADRVGAIPELAPDADPVSARRLSIVGLDLALAARMTPADTIYCPAALRPIASAPVLSAALASGARLQISDRSADADTTLWSELLNSGATIVVADEDLARALADAPLPDRHTVRLVLGEGLSSEIAAALAERLAPQRTRYRTLEGLTR